MQLEKGNLSIHSENIFPIIKKWLYSDHDIFIRELVSNASDAITKLKKLSTMQEIELDETDSFKIDIHLNEKEKTLTFSDNGIGMTDEEIKKYINQIAFSGAEDFLNKYKDKSDKDQIIGHFGLGFYSAFMVAEKVEIHSLSYQSDASPVIWKCDGGTTFEMEEGSRTTRGTDIILYIGEDGLEFLNAYRLKETIQKYCAFMPYEIYLTVEGKEESEETPAEPLNTTLPLYMKMPNECTDEDYKAFYRDTFKDYKDPLFWIHLNMEYPFNLRGILYFPKLSTEFDTMDGQIKLYNSQVFVADNIKEVIPEFLLLLKGVIDCPDLPLNVSRSFLQNDGFVKKISSYISKKVADKLNGLYKTERESYEGFWDDISPFIKFGALKDEKFYENIEKSILYKTINDSYKTLDEYLADAVGKHENKVFYVTDRIQQAQYINLFEAHDLDAVLLEHSIDAPFISMMESKVENVSFARVDSDVNEYFRDTDTEEDETVQTSNQEKLSSLFKDALSMEELEVKLERMKNDHLSSMIILSEESRRMQDMMRLYGGAGLDPKMFATNGVLILNSRHPLVQRLLEENTVDESAQKLICEHLYDLAMLSHTQLTPDAMAKFIKRSNDLLLKII